MQRMAATLYERRWLGALLAPPMGWFALVYVPALLILLITAFWSVNSFTGSIDHTWSLSNFRLLVTSHTYRHIILLTIGMAVAVTITDIVLAFPMAYFAARIARRRLRMLLFGMMALPLWGMFVGPIYAWILILSHDGILNWLLLRLGLPRAHLGYTNWAVWIILVYQWLPFVVMPIYVAVERIPASYLEASRDLGGHGWRTFRKVIFPLALPGVIAGSIFSFSLSLGEYITPTLAGGPASDLLGNVINSNVGAANNIPFAAAMGIVPIVVMAIYLAVARRMGAFEMM